MLFFVSMRFGGGPEGSSFGFEEVGISELERLDLMRAVAAEVEVTAHKFATSEINRDPLLHTLLGKVVESGAELDDIHLAHLRKMIALKLGGLHDIATQAAQDQKFFGLMSSVVETEIEELNALAEANKLPDLWDIAYEDLLRLEGNE